MSAELPIVAGLGLRAERFRLESVGADARGSADARAYETAKRANPSLSEAERQYALTVARGEGFYGLGWRDEGVGSNNWGAVQGVGSAGSFQTVDHHADGTEYIGTFKRYLTPEEGFQDLARILLKPNVRAALRRGSLRDAVFAQHKNRYFELAPSRYLVAVKRNYGELTGNLGWQRLLSEHGGGSLLSFVVGVGLVGYGLWSLTKEHAA